MKTNEIPMSTLGRTSYGADAQLGLLSRKDADGLYTLALLLTADRSKAEHCVVSGLDDACVGGNEAFRDWAHAWARRIVVGNALRMIRPRSDREIRSSTVPRARRIAGTPAATDQAETFVRITSLQDAERCVYVLSVFEGYSDRECASLLGVSVDQIGGIRNLALSHVENDEVVGHRNRSSEDGHMKILEWINLVFALIATSLGVTVLRGVFRHRLSRRSIVRFLRYSLIAAVAGLLPITHHLTSTQEICMLSVYCSGAVMLAVHEFHLGGIWSSLFAGLATAGLYLNVVPVSFQLFKSLHLSGMEATGFASIFAIAQLMLASIFTVLGVLAVRSSHASLNDRCDSHGGFSPPAR